MSDVTSPTPDELERFMTPLDFEIGRRLIDTISAVEQLGRGANAALVLLFRGERKPLIIDDGPATFELIDLYGVVVLAFVGETKVVDSRGSVSIPPDVEASKECWPPITSPNPDNPNGGCVSQLCHYTSIDKWTVGGGCF